MNYKSVTLIEFLGTNPELPCLGRTTVEFVLQETLTLSTVVVGLVEKLKEGASGPDFYKELEFIW